MYVIMYVILIDDKHHNINVCYNETCSYNRRDINNIRQDYRRIAGSKGKKTEIDI